MNGSSHDTVDPEAIKIDPLPDSLSGGSTALVASTGDPAQHAICLRLLDWHGTAADTGVVVTTTESADQTIETYAALETETDQPSLGIVDTTSEQQSVSAPYGETPVVFTPSPGDLERLVLALSDVSETMSPSNGARHLVMRSLTPVLESAPTSRVCTVLERITGLRSEDGLCLIGLDYTAHDQETMTALADVVDGVLWITHSAPDQLEFNYQSTRNRYNRPLLSDHMKDYRRD